MMNLPWLEGMFAIFKIFTFFLAAEIVFVDALEEDHKNE